ncbi:amidase signature domain-containing protein [Sphaerosporella brunnea]|uniref:Amidase signature domain-containing protein n=1 Tax=Sphaerosporella brunnea TaxID=1250544 RepID=A0A5J5F889_9PEZI|nr:amidase signature domain-containing protein [Sphaerosporella brunnea]
MTTNCSSYPSPTKAPDSEYENPPPTNPTLHGTALSVLSSLVAHVGPLQQILYNNAGFTQAFAKLHEAGVLDAYTPRYDPTVVPISTSNDQSAAIADPTTATPINSVFHSSANYIEAYKSGATTPTAVAERFLQSLESDNRNIFIVPTAADDLLAAARASAERYAAGNPLPLDGVPLVVKDEIDVAGTRKTLGLSLDEAKARVSVEASKETSWCVQKLLDAGMLFLGKTNMHELGLDTTNNNPNWGTPRNPYNSGYYSGGSSGGSGAAVGSGIVPIAVGADGGGSVRVPAAYCGAYGLKPSHNRVSFAPSLSIAPSVGVIGPIAATMADIEIAYRLMATPDPSTPVQFPAPGLPTPANKTIGIFTPWFSDCDATVSTHANAALSVFREKGYETVEITLPFLAESRKAHALTILAEIAEVFCRGNTRGLTPANKVLVSVGTRATARDLMLAQKLRALMMSHLAHLFAQHPGLIIVTPTMPHAGVPIAPSPSVAAKGSAGVSDSNTSLRSMQYVFLANWCGCPALTVPVGYDKESGMPISVMGMAEWGGEETLISWGKVWEQSWEGMNGDLRGNAEGGRKRPEGWIDMFTGGSA